MLGPWDWKPSSGRMLLQVAKGRALFAPWGMNSYCDVRDVAAAAITAAERGVAGRRYILAGESHSYFQAWKIMAQVTGAAWPANAGGSADAACQWACWRCLGKDYRLRGRRQLRRHSHRNATTHLYQCAGRSGTGLPLAPAGRIGRSGLVVVSASAVTLSLAQSDSSFASVCALAQIESLPTSASYSE